MAKHKVSTGLKATPPDAGGTNPALQMMQGRPYHGHRADGNDCAGLRMCAYAMDIVQVVYLPSRCLQMHVHLPQHMTQHVCT